MSILRLLFGEPKHKRRIEYHTTTEKRRIPVYPFEFLVFENRSLWAPTRFNLGVYGLVKKTKTLQLKHHLELPEAVFESFKQLSMAEWLPTETRVQFRVKYLEWEAYRRWLDGQSKQDVPRVTPDRNKRSTGAA